jgi:hypothetical protein
MIGDGERPERPAGPEETASSWRHGLGQCLEWNYCGERDVYTNKQFSARDKMISTLNMTRNTRSDFNEMRAKDHEFPKLGLSKTRDESLSDMARANICGMRLALHIASLCCQNGMSMEAQEVLLREAGVPDPQDFLANPLECDGDVDKLFASGPESNLTSLPGP